MKKNKALKISLVLNIIITLMVLAACIMMFTGFRFMKGNEVVLEKSKLGMFKFFTVDSNIFMGVIALLFALQEIKVLRKEQKDISRLYYLLKLMATTGVGLTFVVVFAYLGPICDGGTVVLLKNSNLFFHLIIPVLSMLTFIIFERNDKLTFKYSFYGLIPMLLYGLYYVINILVHMENGKVSTKYDWYWFVQQGVWTAFIVVPILVVITYIISVILWRINRKKVKK